MSDLVGHLVEEDAVADLCPSFDVLDGQVIWEAACYGDDLVLEDLRGHLGGFFEACTWTGPGSLVGY